MCSNYSDMLRFIISAICHFYGLLDDELEIFYCSFFQKCYYIMAPLKFTKVSKYDFEVSKSKDYLNKQYMLQK